MTDEPQTRSRPLTRSRAEHLAWCQQRALAYLDAGDLYKAFASLASDLQKHPETRDHPGVQQGMRLAATGALRPNDLAAMRRFIEGFS